MNKVGYNQMSGYLNYTFATVNSMESATNWAQEVGNNFLRLFSDLENRMVKKEKPFIYLKTGLN